MSSTTLGSESSCPGEWLGQVDRHCSDFPNECQMPLPRLYLNHIADFDRLMALEFGRVYDGQPRENWQEVGEHFGFLHDGADGSIVGFGVNEFATFDVDDPNLAEIWTAAEFEIPLLGLPRANAAETILAARPLLGDHSTVNREFFAAAVDSQRGDPEEALALWLSCLEAGDSMAHFALGYTLYELERYHEAYRHLRYYVQIAPAAPWNWCWVGKAAAAIGERGEARSAYERAIELSGEEDETDAPELLRQLGNYQADTPRGSAAGYFARMAGEPRRSKPRDPKLGERFELALQFAAATHRTQVRKGSGIPYVGHLLGVCSLVIEDGGSEDEAIGALLHDAAEDQGGQAMLEDIRVRFGEHVAAIVEACSDTMESPKPPWRTRKEAYVQHLEAQSESVLRVSLADKLFNARAILRDYLVVGDEIWARFQSGRDGQLWYYRQLADRFNTLLPGRLACELSEVVDELEEAVIA
jgi:GTP pyrophosphokinase